MKRVNREMGITIMLITHQMQVIQLICDRVAVMEDGKIVEEGNVLDVFGRPQAEVTKRIANMDRITPEMRPLPPEGLTPPSTTISMHCSV